MADDIVTKLRDFTWEWDDLVAAADEIERLRAAGDALARLINAPAWSWQRDNALSLWQEVRRER